MLAPTAKSVWLALMPLAIGVIACKNDPDPPQATPQSALPAATMADPPPNPLLPSHSPDTAESLSLIWKAPATWRQLPARNEMRKATYLVPRTQGDSEDGELAVFYFGTGQGGSIEANVDRWLRQFSGVKPNAVLREERKANGLRQHVVRLDSAQFIGAMSDGPAAPKDSWGLRGAIVETPNGPYFFKLTGPAKTLRATDEGFDALLSSVNLKH